MIKTIVSNEIRLYVFSRRTIFIYIILLFLALANIIFSLSTYNDSSLIEQKFYNEQKEDLNQKTKSVHNSILGSYHTLRTNPKLSFISSKDKDLPNYIEMNIFRLKNIGFYHEKRVQFYDISDIDWLFIVGLLLSFFSIVLTFDSINNDKIKGILKLNLSSSITRTKFLIGKFLSRFLLLYIPFIIAFLISIIAFLSFGNVDFSNIDYLRILLFTLISGIYISIFITIGILISTINLNSGKSILILFSIWFFFILIIPAVAKLTILNFNSMKAKNEQNVSLQSNDFQKHVFSSSNNLQKQIEILRQRSNFLNTNFIEYNNKIINRISKAQRIMYISPYCLFESLSQGVTNTGFSNYIRFYESAKIYRTTLFDYIIKEDLKDKASKHLISEDPNFNSASKTKLDASTFPEYKFLNYSIADIRHLSFELILLLFYFTISAITCWYFFNKFDVT